MQQEILYILRKNSRISDEELAIMMGTDVESVTAVIKDM